MRTRTSVSAQERFPSKTVKFESFWGPKEGKSCYNFIFMLGSSVSRPLICFWTQIYICLVSYALICVNVLIINIFHCCRVKEIPHLEVGRFDRGINHFPTCTRRHSWSHTAHRFLKIHYYITFNLKLIICLTLYHFNMFYSLLLKMI